MYHTGRTPKSRYADVSQDLPEVNTKDIGVKTRVLLALGLCRNKD